jgi:hypothetical protein
MYRALANCLLGLGCLAHIGAHAHECHRVGDEVRLSGSLTHKAFAGPPNYVDSRHGDARESVPVLSLSAPLCVRREEVPGERRVRPARLKAVQVLDVHEQLAGDARRHCARRCSLTGRLVEAESGHHHTPVVLELGDD